MTPQCPLTKSPCTHPKCIREGMCQRSAAGVHKVVVVVDGSQLRSPPSLEQMREGLSRYVDELNQEREKREKGGGG